MKRLIDAYEVQEKLTSLYKNATGDARKAYSNAIDIVCDADEIATTMHGKWIECDYKYLEHGMLETEPNAGLCCSNCRAAFRKKNMTYKQFCAACGARIDLMEVE